jgi:hypothetical protein
MIKQELDNLNIKMILGGCPMLTIPSRIENVTISLYELERRLKPLGYVIAGNWDYDHGYFDYKIDDEVGYQFLRVPFKAEDGQLDSDGATVRLEEPFLLSHKYQRGIDDHAGVGDFSASFDQFQEPQDNDADIPEQYREIGQSLVKELEEVILD